MQILVVLFVTEYITIMLSFFTYTSLSGALPITICVCSSIVLGFILKIQTLTIYRLQVNVRAGIETASELLIPPVRNMLEIS